MQKESSRDLGCKVRTWLSKALFNYIFCHSCEGRNLFIHIFIIPANAGIYSFTFLSFLRRQETIHSHFCHSCEGRNLFIHIFVIPAKVGIYSFTFLSFLRRQVSTHSHFCNSYEGRNLFIQILRDSCLRRNDRFFLNRIDVNYILLSIRLIIASSILIVSS